MMAFREQWEQPRQVRKLASIPAERDPLATASGDDLRLVIRGRSIKVDRRNAAPSRVAGFSRMQRLGREIFQLDFFFRPGEHVSSQELLFRGIFGVKTELILAENLVEYDFDVVAGVPVAVVVETAGFLECAVQRGAALPSRSAG